MPKIFDPNALFFVPLSGSEEFGANLNLYVCNDDFLAVDCGIGFADERYPGIDLLLPDPWLLDENKGKLKGLVITHAHEDHIGAVAYLWDKLECPIYTTEFTATVLRKKFEQAGIKDAEINIIELEVPFKAGQFTLSFIPVSHSVPGSFSVFIETPHGNVLHSGDWNLDPNPVIGRKTEESIFRDIGSKRVLAYVGDSTNAEIDGYSGSESDVAEGMVAEFEKCKGKIAVTIFSSNISRIISVARAAQAVGRSVALIGRSLHRMVGCAYDCGLMDGVPEFLSEDEMVQVADENLVLIATGSQGEHRAALARISRGEYRTVSLGKNDTVIFSARSIPGNERTINTVKNALCGAGVRVVTPRDTKNVIHVSGHPHKGEIAEMLQWVKPSCVIPVHGERMQLEANANISKKCQIKRTLVPNNGSVIRLAPNEPEIVDHLKTAMLAVDKSRIIPITHQSITARRKLQYSGTVHVSLVLNQDLEIIGNIKINTVGLSCIRSDDCIIEELKEFIKSTLDGLNDIYDSNEDAISEAIRIPLRKYVGKTLGLQPKTTVHVICVDL